VGSPVHVPVSAYTVSPICALPLILGGTTFAGGAGSGPAGPMGPTCRDVAVAVPAGFVAVTVTRRPAPTSALSIA
jgi:hypothetical protein